MAQNPNTSLPNNNHLYLACSGGGKSQALSQNKSIPYRNARVLLWDIDHDHRATRFEDMRLFYRAVISAIKSGRGFRLAYSGNDSVTNFELFCQIAWASLNGNKKTYVIIEELADVCITVGKASPEFGRLLRKGRKFGAELHITTQRGAEIPKTAYTQCPVKIVGQQEGADIEKMAKVAGVSIRDISALNPLQFYVKKAGAEPGQLLKLKYKKPN